jgi:hypothetical protein
VATEVFEGAGNFASIRELNAIQVARVNENADGVFLCADGRVEQAQE